MMLPWIVGLGVVALYLWQRGRPSAPLSALPSAPSVPLAEAPPAVNLPASWRNPTLIAPGGASAPAPSINYGPVLNAFGQFVGYAWGQVQADGSIDPATAESAGSAFDAAANTIGLGGGSAGPDVGGSVPTTPDVGGGGVGATGRRIVTVHTTRGWVRRVSV